MTDGALGRTTTAVGYQVQRLTDRRRLEARLSDDRPFAAYALGHLEPDLFEFAEYWTADGPHGAATVMHATALGPVTVAVGDAEAVAAILAIHPGPRLGYLSTGAPEHQPAFADSHIVTDVLHMVRMSTTALTFQDLPADRADLRRLRGHDANRLNALYSTDGPLTRYSPTTIERAIYYGAFRGDQLVAAAGTHIVSPHQSIAVVGNVFTHPAHRGHGLAQQVTAAVTRDLLSGGCSEAVLTVNPDNLPAVAAYTRLGYRRGSEVIEARLQRRDLIGFGPFWRRTLARRRGRSYGDNIEWVRGRPHTDTAADRSEDSR